MHLYQVFTRPWAALGKLVFMTLAIGLSLPATANMVVYPMNSTIGAEQDGIGQIQLHSKSDKVQYIKVNVTQIQRPGTPELEAGQHDKRCLSSERQFDVPSNAHRHLG